MRSSRSEWINSLIWQQPWKRRFHQLGSIIDRPSARRAVHLLFFGEKVRPEYPEALPPLGPSRELRGIRVMPLADLLRMKLTSFRAKDEAHIKDLDDAGLITPDLEADLPALLRERLDQARLRA